MEKPPKKKRWGPYWKRNFDSEFQPIHLTLETPEINITESTSTLQYSSAIGTRDVTEVFHSFDLEIYYLTFFVRYIEIKPIICN